MTGEKAFQDVINFVAKSKLNFSILQTPFSAQLSLKKSFAKNIHDDDSDQSTKIIEESDETIIWKFRTKELESRLIVMNLENLQLKKKLEECENSIHNLENKCKSLEDNLKVEKKRVKKERQKEEKQEHRVKVENVDNEEDVDVPNVPTNNIFEILRDVASDQKIDVKQINKKEFASQTEVFECDICSEYFIMETSLKDHTKRKHKQTSESETQTFMKSKISTVQQTVNEKTECENSEYENYSCFYCEKEITSEVPLLEHRISCHGAAETPSLFSCPVRSLYECVICGLVASCRADMVDHKKSMHQNQ